MLIIKHTLETNVPPKQIWQVWEDVETWKSWDHEIEFSKMDGPFETGTRGRLKMHNSPILETKITQCEHLRKYVFEANLFLAKSVSTSLIQQRAGKTYVTFQNEVRGPLAFFYVLLIGRRIKQKTPNEMREMLQKAEQLAGMAQT